MSIIKTRYRAYKRTRQDFTGETLIYKEWAICGIRVWRRLVDQEPIPAFAFIQLACLGSTDWVNPIWARHKNKDFE